MDGFKNRMEMTEKRVGKLEHRSIESIQSEKKKMEKNGQIPRDRFPGKAFRSLESQKDSRKHVVKKNVFKITTEYFINLPKDVNLEMH